MGQPIRVMCPGIIRLLGNWVIPGNTRILIDDQCGGSIVRAPYNRDLRSFFYALTTDYSAKHVMQIFTTDD